VKRTDIAVTIVEKSTYMGGISRTINYKGNRIDIGGHRFFSKSDRVMDWWLNIMPLQATAADELHSLSYQQKKRQIGSTAHGPNPEADDCVMLVRNRKSRIYFMRRFFEYPITLSVDTVKKLGLLRMMKIGTSYLKSLVFPIKKPEQNLEEFFTNRFGKELYLTFFKSYTEKVWGVPCHQISAAWGAQRTKGLSIIKTITHALRKMILPEKDVRQKGTETSLIEKFLYPKLGPGQMWETVADLIKKEGVEIMTEYDVTDIHVEGMRVKSVIAKNSSTGDVQTLEGDYFFSTMPVRDLVRALDAKIPQSVKEISEGLMYRDFVIVGLLVDKLKIFDQTPNGQKLISDNWIYIQEPDVLLGRLQIFNNWSPYMVADSSKVWLGLEYFCNDTDDIWTYSDEKMIALATSELFKIGIIDQSAVLDATVTRMPKTYPGYFGTYDRFDELQSYLDGYENLFLIGRNGMHKYNNQDHSMLTAMVAVDNIVAGITTRDNIWSINAEMGYHEEKEASKD
jgi:protoporphyrinogen oxidase